MADIFTPVFKIKVDGSDLSEDLWNNSFAITVEEEINLPTMFTITLSLPDEELTGDWEGVDLSTFKVGSAVTISMGAEEAKSLMSSGEITSLDFYFDKSPRAEIRGYDKMHRLRFGTKTRSFTEKKDSDLVSTLASEAGLSAQIVDATTTVYPYLFQNNQSNYAFLLERAARIGYELLGQDGKVLFRKSKENETPTKANEFTYGLNIHSFHVGLRTLIQGSDVEVRGWDIKTKEALSFKATTGSEDGKMGGSQSGHQLSSTLKTSPMAVLDQMVLDAKDAENIAKGLYNTSMETFIEGEGVYSGETQIRAGTTVKILGLGKKFSGNYYVYATVHTVDLEGYRTLFKVRKTGI